MNEPTTEEEEIGAVGIEHDSVADLQDMVAAETNSSILSTRPSRNPRPHVSIRVAHVVFMVSGMARNKLKNLCDNTAIANCNLHIDQFCINKDSIHIKDYSVSF